MNPNKQETKEDHEDEEDVTASIGEGRLSLQSLPVGVSRAFNRQKTQESQQETSTQEPCDRCSKQEAPSLAVEPRGLRRTPERAHGDLRIR